MTPNSEPSLTSASAVDPFPHRGSLQAFAAVCLGCLVIGFAGCDFGASEPEKPSAEERPAAASSVPLRIVSTAPEDFNERLQLAWNAVSEQPLEITSATAATLPDEAERTDVVLFPTSAMGDLQAADLLTPLAESFLQSERIDAETLLPGLVNSSMEWGDTAYALPLGTALPAVWTSAEMETGDTETAESLTWSEYSELIEKLPKGESAEPLAEGWAAVALLNRTSTLTSATWLFERNTLAPVLETPPYVRALEQLVADRQRYPEELLTPEEVWSRLHAGELQIAIGWPASSSAASGSLVGGESGPAVALQMLPYPTAEEIFVDDWKPAESIPRPPLVSPRAWMVAVAASCRQTAAARTFIGWLAGREGHASVRTASPDLAANRTATPPSDAGGLPLAPDSHLSRGNYDEYVIGTLSDGQVRPTLRLPGADAYLTALDAQVVRALAGEIEADEALAAAAEQWEAITERLGRQRQLRAWRQAQGLRGR